MLELYWHFLTGTSMILIGALGKDWALFWSRRASCRVMKISSVEINILKLLAYIFINFTCDDSL